MAFIFSYDAVSGERETGTMRLVLSYSVPRDRFILAKWLGGYFCLLTPFVMGLGVAAVVILLSREVGFTASEWIAYAVAAGASCLFIAVMFSIGVFVSSRCTRSATAIVILLLIWVGMVLFVPNVSPYVSNQIRPVTPSDVIENEMSQEMGDLLQEFNRNIEREYQQLAAQMRQGGPESEQAQMEFAQRLNMRWREFKDATNAAAERGLKDFDRELDAQTEVAKMISRLSPVSSYVYIATDVAGTGLRRQEHFMDALREYHTAFRAYIDQKTQGLAPWMTEGSGIDYDISDMPVFEYVEEPISARVAGSVLDFGLLGVEALFFFVAAFVSFVRADVV
jgi:ABC-type transport system involved in multi-copper enzyme maturation permease subunit